MKCLLSDTIVLSAADLTGNKIWFLLSQEERTGTTGGILSDMSREYGIRAIQ